MKAGVRKDAEGVFLGIAGLRVMKLRMYKTEAHARELSRQERWRGDPLASASCLYFVRQLRQFKSNAKRRGDRDALRAEHGGLDLPAAYRIESGRVEYGAAA